MRAPTAAAPDLRHAHQRREAPGQSARHSTGAAGVSRGRPFTEQLDVYKVAGKVFLVVTDDLDERIVTLKAEPEYGWLLQHEHPSIARAYQPNLRYPAHRRAVC
ncbi:MmcQ/YjbR family DNA-binding protein [Streptomyces sp. NPDC059441]|uniref:MmcQ/YjbR family DNA-binding protein n=1 Tax=Streptomyces sp. NPDC059441 TaxID=3346829 RepID=UPI0036A94105